MVNITVHADIHLVGIVRSVGNEIVRFHFNPGDYIITLRLGETIEFYARGTI